MISTKNSQELKEGQVTYNGNRFTRDKKNGYYLSSRNLIDGKRVRLHRYIWIINNGEIPNGLDVHHKDENKDNNDITNLMLIPSSKHQKYHTNKEMLMHYEERKRKFIKYAHPAAAEWHGSEEGIAWHKEHWKNSIGKYADKTYKKTCVVCGAEYDAPLSCKNTGVYCSPKCKAKYRRDNKLDHIEKSCIVCGNKFLDSKYEDKKTCSKECRKKLFLLSRCGKGW